MKNHFEPYLSLSTDAPDIDHLNQLFNQKYIQIP